jgi:hypothetical protein
MSYVTVSQLFCQLEVTFTFLLAHKLSACSRLFSFSLTINIINSVLEVKSVIIKLQAFDEILVQSPSYPITIR